MGNEEIKNVEMVGNAAAGTYNGCLKRHQIGGKKYITVVGRFSEVLFKYSRRFSSSFMCISFRIYEARADFFNQEMSI